MFVCLYKNKLTVGFLIYCRIGMIFENTLKLFIICVILTV